MTIESPRAIAYDLVQDWAATWPAYAPRNARADLADRIASAVESDRANMRNAVLQSLPTTPFCDPQEIADAIRDIALDSQDVPR